MTRTIPRKSRNPIPVERRAIPGARTACRGYIHVVQPKKPASEAPTGLPIASEVAAMLSDRPLRFPGVLFLNERGGRG